MPHEKPKAPKSFCTNKELAATNALRSFSATSPCSQKNNVPTLNLKAKKEVSLPNLRHRHDIGLQKKKAAPAKDADERGNLLINFGFGFSRSNASPTGATLGCSLQPITEFLFQCSNQFPVFSDQ
jgi:hypothetical protein